MLHDIRRSQSIGIYFNLLLISFLKIARNLMCFFLKSYSATFCQLSPDAYPSPSYTTPCLLFFLKPLRLNLCCPCSFGRSSYVVLNVWVFHCSVVNFPGLMLLKKTFLLFAESLAHCSLSRDGTLCSPPFSMLGFGLPWTCTHFMYAENYTLYENISPN